MLCQSASCYNCNHRNELGTLEQTSCMHKRLLAWAVTLMFMLQDAINLPSLHRCVLAPASSQPCMSVCMDMHVM